MLIQMLPMLLVCGLGWGLRRGDLLTRNDAQTLGKVITYLALPAVILRALATASMTPDFVYLPLAAGLVVLGLTAIAAMLLRALRWDRPQAGALITTFPTFEGGAVGYPLMLLAFGEAGLSRLVLFDLAQAIYLLTVVYALAAWFGQAQISPKAIATKLTKTPFFWAIWVGLGANASGLQSPLLLNLLDILANSFVLLVLLLLGMEFQVPRSAVGRYGLLALAKIGCGLGLGWLATSLFNLTGIERAAVLVGSALPPSLLTLLFAQENQLDSRFTVSFISVAVPLYVLIMTRLLDASIIR